MNHSLVERRGVKIGSRGRTSSNCAAPGHCCSVLRPPKRFKIHEPCDEPGRTGPGSRARNERGGAMPGADADAQPQTRSRGAGRVEMTASTVSGAGSADRVIPAQAPDTAGSAGMAATAQALASLADEALIDLIQRQTF